MTARNSSRILDALASLKLTLVCLVLLMVLVVGCTLAQVTLGTLPAVDAWIRTFFVWANLPGSDRAIPVFPGGAFVGLVLMVNLVVAQGRRLELTWRKAGLWVVHAGLILLFVGEFVTSMFQVEMQLAIEEGQTLDYVESPRQLELAITDTTNPDHDEVYGIPDSLLSRSSVVQVPGTPVSVKLHAYYENAELVRKTDPGPSIATAGIGPNIAVRELPPARGDNDMDRPAAYVEAVAGGRSYGTWLVSSSLGAPQSFIHEGHTYELALRPRREYLPYSLTLKKFSHDVYAGTDIPKNFSSLVTVNNPASGENRDVLIFMNQPLRYAGKAFYQASFGKNDTLSILQVVQNPGWLLPYISCLLVAAGLIFHFTLSLMRATRRRAAAMEPA